MRISGKNSRRSLGSPSWYAWVTIRTVADRGQIVGNRGRLYPELCDYASLVAQDLASAIQLDDTGPHDALAEVLVRSTNDNLSDPLILCCFRRGRSECIVGLEFDHRPHQHSHRLQCLFENWKLRQQCRIDAFASLVTWIEIVPKRLNHMVGRNSDVRCSSPHHRENRSKHTAYRTNLLATGIFGGRHGIKVAEEFVGAVNEIDIHEWDSV